MLPSASLLTLASALIKPGKPADSADLGSEHRLVAMVCFMEASQHYVVFCRRQSNPNSWLFFNDLPGLARGMRREYHGWSSVAHECARFELRPKVLFYESTAAASRAVGEASPSLQASVGAAAVETARSAAAAELFRTRLRNGVGGCLLVIVLALVVQQILGIWKILFP